RPRIPARGDDERAREILAERRGRGPRAVAAAVERRARGVDRDEDPVALDAQRDRDRLALAGAGVAQPRRDRALRALDQRPGVSQAALLRDRADGARDAGEEPPLPRDGLELAL